MRAIIACAAHYTWNAKILGVLSANRKLSLCKPGRRLKTREIHHDPPDHTRYCPSAAGRIGYLHFLKTDLKTQKGLRPGSIRSYRDTLKVFIADVANNCRRPITRLILSDLAAQRVLDFLRVIEVTRGNHVSTRNQRLAALHTLYRYLDLQYPETLADAQRVEAIPMKRTALRKLIT